MESGFTVLCTGTRNAPLPSIPCLLTPYTYSCRKLNPSYLFFFPIHSMQQIHILVITGCLYTVPFEAHCKHRTDTLPEFFIVIFSPDISASCLILSGSFFPQLELSFVGFCGGSDGKESACSSGDPGSILGWRRSPGEGNGYPLQCSCLGNLMNRGAWWAIVHGVAKSWVRHDFSSKQQDIDYHELFNTVMLHMYPTVFSFQDLWEHAALNRLAI